MVLSCLGFYINAIKWEEGELKIYELSNRELVSLYCQFIDRPSDLECDSSSYDLMCRFFDSICKRMAAKFCAYVEGGQL